MTCPNCGARIMEGAAVCVRCGKEFNSNGQVVNKPDTNTYVVNGQVLDASRTVLDEGDIGKKRKNFLGPAFFVVLFAGLVYVVVVFFPIQDIINIFNGMSDNIAETIARKTLTNVGDYYTTLLYESGGTSLVGKEFDIHVLDDKYKDSKVESGKFVIVDETEYGVELRDVIIQGYTCNGNKETLKCEKKAKDIDLSELMK